DRAEVHARLPRHVVGRPNEGSCAAPWARGRAEVSRPRPSPARMLAYVARRLLFMIPTLFGVMVINFAIIQAAPGGPVEQMIARIKGTAVEATARFGGAGGAEVGGRRPAEGGQGADVLSKYRGARGLDPELIRQLEKLYGFDKPPAARFVLMMKHYLAFDFGQSFFQDRPVIDLIASKLPVSISLGLWTTLLVYLISIPLGIAKAVRDGAGLTMLTKNAFLDEINKQYVVTARAKGLTGRRVLYGHVFRNAMLIVIAGFPAAFVGILFTGELLIEVIFSLDGLGLLGFNAAINRDYPIMFATFYIYTLIGLLLNLVTDLTYVAVDPRIDFASREP